MIALSKKVCLLGDFAVGKTSLVRRFVYNLFDDKYISTIGVKVSRKMVAVPRVNDVVELTMMLWDLAGSEEFGHVRTSYLRGAAGAILVCDLTRPETLTNLGTYAAHLRESTPHIPLIVAANKLDLTSMHRISESQVGAAAAGLGALYHLTSARLGDEIETLFRRLGGLLVAE